MILKEDSFNKDIESQIAGFLAIIKQNTALMHVINQAALLNYPQWYIGAGCLAQTVWNHYAGRPLIDSIKDIDWVYFDNQDLSKDKEVSREREAQASMGNFRLCPYNCVKFGNQKNP